MARRAEVTDDAKAGDQKVVDRLKDEFKDPGFAAWLADRHPQIYNDLSEQFSRQGYHIGTADDVRGGEASPDATALWTKQLEDLRGKGSASKLRADYATWQKAQSEDYADAVGEAYNRGALGPEVDDQQFAESAPNRVRFEDRYGKRQQAAENEARGTGTAPKPGGSSFDASGTGTTGRGRINLGELSQLIMASPTIDTVLTAAGGGVQPDIFGPKQAGHSVLDKVPVQVTGTGGYDQHRDALARNQAAGDREQRGHRSAFNPAAAARGENPYNTPGSDLRMRTDERRRATGSGVPGAMGALTTLRMLSTLDRDSLIRLQQHMIMAGLYNDNVVDENMIGWGYANDPYTQEAWQRIILEHLASPEKSVEDLLVERQRAYGPHVLAIASGAGRDGRTLEVSLADPDTISQAAEQYFVESLGRLPTPEEKAKLVSTIQGKQRAVGQSKLAQFSAGIDRRPKGPDGQPIGTVNPNRDELDAILNNTTRGTITNPLPGAHYSNDWGQARSGGRHHQGTDMFAPTGTPIYAARAGTIKKLGSGGVQGHMLSVSITGVDSNNYFYNHMDPNRKIVQPGQKIEAGQIIGYVGDGALIGSASHLHFSINEGTSRAVNPYPILKGSTSGGYSTAMPFGPDTISGTEAAARGDQLITTEDVDPAAEVAESAKREHPVEYGAQQLGNAYERFTKILIGDG